MDLDILVALAAAMWGLIAAGVVTLCRAAANADRESEHLHAELLSLAEARRREAIAALIRRAVTGA